MTSPRSIVRGARALWWLGWLVAIAPRLATAQSSPQAEQLFRDGRQLMAQQQYGEACAAFEASQHIEPAISTAMNLAACNEKRGLLATAWGQFLDVAAKTRAADVSAQHDAAVRHAKALEPRLSYLVVRVPPDHRVAGLVITLDRTPLADGAWNRAMPIDGGAHTIEARAAERVAWSTQVTVAPAGDQQTIEVPALAPERREARPLIAAQPRPPVPRAPAPRGRVLPIVLGAGALVALGGGVALERSAEHNYDRSVVEPDDARQDALYDAAVHRRVGAVALGVAGLACAGAAIYWLVRPAAESPAIVPTGNGLAVVGAF